MLYTISIKRLILIALFLSSGLSRAQVFDMLVAREGPGAYRTIQSAIGRIPDYSTQPYRVFIKNGVYNEKVLLPASKTNVCLIGESVDGVIITYDDYNGKDGITTASSYTFMAEGGDLYAENITFQNSAGNVGQAVAIRTTGERQVFKNCRFLGFQDTYYAHKNRQYNLLCEVEGATDFIFGDATAVFDSCIITCLKGGQYITAPSDTKLTSQKPDGTTLYHGLLFRNSEILCNDDVPAASYYLGRPWQPNASAVYIRCILGDHIKAEGWSIWSGTDNHLSGFYGECLSRNPGGELVDTVLRVDWSHQITPEEADTFYSPANFFRKLDTEWDPLPRTVAFHAPFGLSGDGYRLTWQADVPQGTGFLIIRNDSAIGFSDTACFADATADPSVVNTYKVKSVAIYGNLSPASDEFVVAASRVQPFGYTPDVFTIRMKADMLYVSEPAQITVFSLSGIPVRFRDNASEVSVKELPGGPYIIKAVNCAGQTVVQKIIH